MSKIEYFYAGYSAFAYLGHAELLRISDTTAWKIDHRPIDLRAVVAEMAPSKFGTRSKPHMDYYFGREIERWAEHRGVPVLAQTPTHHSNDITRSNCMLIAGLVEGINIDTLSHEMLRAHWVDDYDVDNPEDLKKIAATVGLDGEALLSRGEAQDVKDIYEANTREAIERSVFGSPTYFVNGDMFYGQDHLEMVERAIRKPYAGRWPRSA